MSTRRYILLVLGGIVLLSLFMAVVVIPTFFTTSYSAQVTGEDLPGQPLVAEPGLPPIIHLQTPEPMKALYMTACVAGTPSWRTRLKALIEETELNAVVIDIKDATGRVSFPNTFPKTANQKGCLVGDMREFIAELHASGIYVAGRISVFQDPSYTELFPELAVKSLASGGVWKDHKGLSFIDVGAKTYWDYIVEISKEAYKIGFDELNYDYVRYPSDGVMSDASFTWMEASSTKAATLESFFSYLSTHVRDETDATLSADLFGMTTTVEGDMGIGQVLERALPYFDYIAPMVYPSHYPATWSGFQNPAEFPYEVVRLAMSAGRERELALQMETTGATTTSSKLRPWLQDFNLGATYTPEKVKAQIQATYDSGLTSWMIWNAGNKYTREALLNQ